MSTLNNKKIKQWLSRQSGAGELILNCFQDETNPLVFLAGGFVARSSQPAMGMLLTRASPPAKNPARLSPILKAT
jgi:hypothetical protein